MAVEAVGQRTPATSLRTSVVVVALPDIRHTIAEQCTGSPYSSSPLTAEY